MEKKETGSLQDILNAAYKALGNPIFVFNMEYELIAHSDGADNDDSICMEFLEYGKLGSETLEFFKNECFIDAVASCDGVTYLISDKLKYDRIFGQLYNKKRLPVADLVIVACEKPFEPNTANRVKELCEDVSKFFSKDTFYQVYGHAYQEAIVTKLIKGNIENKGIYAGHVANIDNGLKDNIFMAVGIFAQSDLTYNNLACHRDLFARTFPAFKWFVYGQHLVALISSATTEIDATELKKLRRLLKHKGMRMGISDCFENLFTMHMHYAQALHALESSKHDGKESIFFFTAAYSAE